MQTLNFSCVLYMKHSSKFRDMKRILLFIRICAIIYYLTVRMRKYVSLTRRLPSGVARRYRTLIPVSKPEPYPFMLHITSNCKIYNMQISQQAE